MFDTVIWGTAVGDNVVWGTAASGDNIVWGTLVAIFAGWF